LENLKGRKLTKKFSKKSVTKVKIKRYFLGVVTGGPHQSAAASDFEKRVRESIKNRGPETHPAAAAAARQWLTAGQT
jgi:hypothetical protein